MKKKRLPEIAIKFKNRDKTKEIPFNYEIKVKNEKLKNKNDDTGQKRTVKIDKIKSLLEAEYKRMEIERERNNQKLIKLQEKEKNKEERRFCKYY